VGIYNLQKPEESMKLPNFTITKFYRISPFFLAGVLFLDLDVPRAQAQISPAPSYTISVDPGDVPETHEASFRWFGKHRGITPCPREAIPTPPTLTVPSSPEKLPSPPEVKPPTELIAEPSLDTLTSAALGSSMISINMFGDRFGGGGPSAILIGVTRTIPNLRIINENSMGNFVAPVPQGKLGFANTGANPIPYFLSVAGAGPGPVFSGRVIGLDKNQPFINGNLQGPNSVPGNYQIRNGQAIVTSNPSFANINYTEVNQLFINVPNPGSGGVVGRPKISEDLNPLPRDRFIFNYDYFNQTPLGTNGFDVHRSVLGFEKTFFNQMASVEVRVPFASTLNSTFTQGTEASNMELGDVRVLLKGLLYSSDTINVGGGLGIYLPTADNIRLVSGNGTEVVRIDNQAVILSPFLGFLLTPTNRLFAQAWAGCDFDINGCPVQVNSGFRHLQPAGRIQDQAFLQLDGQIGFWLFRPGERTGIVQGLAPFVELHYATTLQDADFVRLGGFTIGNLANRYDELNLSAGFAARLFDNLLVTLGGVAPLRQNFDRSFDYQVGLRASWFFGPSAAQPRAATYVSSF
jgi:hypothetical protein